MLNISNNALGADAGKMLVTHLFNSSIIELNMSNI